MQVTSYVARLKERRLHDYAAGSSRRWSSPSRARDNLPGQALELAVLVVAAPAVPRADVLALQPATTPTKARTITTSVAPDAAGCRRSQIERRLAR